MATLEFSRPPGYEDKSDEELVGMIQTAIGRREEYFRQKAGGRESPFSAVAECLSSLAMLVPTSQNHASGSHPGWPAETNGEGLNVCSAIELGAASTRKRLRHG